MPQPAVTECCRIPLPGGFGGQSIEATLEAQPGCQAPHTVLIGFVLIIKIKHSFKKIIQVTKSSKTRAGIGNKSRFYILMKLF